MTMQDRKFPVSKALRRLAPAALLLALSGCGVPFVPFI